MGDKTQIIELPKEQVNDLIKIYTQKYYDAQHEVEKAYSILVNLGADLTEINDYTSASTSASTSGHSAATDRYSDYRDKWSWMRKVKYALKIAGHCLTTREVIEELKRIDPSITTDPINSVSGTISNKVREGVVFKRYQPFDGSEQYVGLIDWWSEDIFGNMVLGDEYKPE